MKAAILKKWLELELCDVNKPILAPGEALIKMRLAGVCGSDMVVYRGKHMTATLPTVLGHEILGTVETLPEGYKGPIRLGQRVIVNPILPCGHCSACKRGLYHVCENLELLGIHVNGGFAEYTKAPVEKLVPLRDDIPDEVAILGEPFAVGYHVMMRTGLEKGDKVFISGGATVGLYIAVFARAFGADRVVISEINEARRQFVESMGIETINPAGKDAMELMREITGGGGFDVVYDTSGAQACVLQMADLCRCGGKIMSLNLSGEAYQFVLGKISFKEITIIGNRLYTQDDFEKGVHFLEDNWKALGLGRMVTDILPLDKVDRALEMMQTGENICKIVLRC